MTIRLVERMTDPPVSCLVCGQGNIPQNDGLVHPAVDLGADVNWGDSTYLCEDCATRVGATVGMLTPDDVQDLRAELEAQKKKLHNLKANADLKRRQARQRVREGVSA